MTISGNQAVESRLADHTYNEKQRGSTTLHSFGRVPVWDLARKANN